MISNCPSVAHNACGIVPTFQDCLSVTLSSICFDYIFLSEDFMMSYYFSEPIHM